MKYLFFDVVRKSTEENGAIYLTDFITTLIERTLGPRTNVGKCGSTT